jgi:hypothetical protein
MKKYQIQSTGAKPISKAAMKEIKGGIVPLLRLWECTDFLFFDCFTSKSKCLANCNYTCTNTNFCR